MRPLNCIVDNDVPYIGLVHWRVRVPDNLSVFGPVAHPLALNVLPTACRTGTAEAQYQMVSRSVELLPAAFGAAVRRL